MKNKKIVFFIIFSMLYSGFIFSSKHEKLIISTTYANIRALPSTKGKIIKKAKFGDNFIIITTKGKWFKIKLNNKNKFGYVHSSIIKLKLKNSKYKNLVTKRKRIYTKIGRKKKKKFPILLVAAGVTVAVVAAILILKKKKDDKADGTAPSENKLANEVYKSIEWKNIPAGSFKMGDNFNEGYSDERPVHKVHLDAFSMSKYEVTFDQYDKFCEDTNREKPSDSGWGRNNRPVINVSWEDAKAFCDWLTEKTGNKISLPTEAQWERAARGGNQRRYPWGSEQPTPTLCNFSSNVHKTEPVGSYSQGISPFGIFDMAGNVQEWCADWFSYNYYSNSPETNPTGPSSGTKRILRGGSWDRGAIRVRCAYRGKGKITDKYNFNGIRLVKNN